MEPLPLKERLRLFIKISKAIEHAHRHGVLHADIKPENIIIDEKGNPKVLDFNITQRIESVPAELDTSLLAFSQKFASPEQIAGQYLDNRSDVFSLGKLLDYLVPEVSADNDIFLVSSQASAIDPDHRYSSVQAMIDDVHNILTLRPITVRKGESGYVLRRFAQRKPFHTMTVFSLILAISVFSGVLIQKNNQLSKEKTIAEKMMFEMTQLLYHSKGNVDKERSVQAMLELTRRRILSSPELPGELKQKILLAMMTPIPDRNTPHTNQPTDK
jgi:serine/threonine-protein kinase